MYDYFHRYGFFLIRLVGIPPTILAEHAKAFAVTFINFISTDRLLSNSTGYNTEFKIGNFIVWVAADDDLLGINLNRDVEFYYLKTGEILSSLAVNTTYVGVNLDHGEESTNDAEIFAEMKFKRRAWYRGKESLPVVVASEWGGKLAGITQVMIGMPISFWLSKLVLLEVMRVYPGSRNLARFGRERFVMVDVDDIFVAPKGLKMTVDDVEVSGSSRCSSGGRWDGCTGVVN